MHAFDRQTDGRTDRRTEISSLRPRCIPCSAVKTGKQKYLPVISTKNETAIAIFYNKNMELKIKFLTKETDTFCSLSTFSLGK